jgi:hypothetical protein
MIGPGTPEVELPPSAYVDAGGGRYSLRGRYCSRPDSGDHEVRLDLWRFDLEIADAETPGTSRCVARIYCIVEVASPGTAACFCDVWVEKAAGPPAFGDFMIARAIDVVRERAGELALRGIAKVDLALDGARPTRSYVNLSVPAGAAFAPGRVAEAGLRRLAAAA